MNTLKPRIWVTNDPCSAAFLKEGSNLFNSSSPRIIVEVSEHPSLASCFGLDTPTSFPGITGLLQEATLLKDLSVLPSEDALPIVFAGGKPASLSAIGSALRKIQARTEDGVQVEILIEIESIIPLLPWLHGFGGIGMLYSLGHSPNQGFEECIQSICEENYLEHEAWNGLLAYDSEHTTSNINDEIIAELKAVPNSTVLEYP